MSAPVRPPSNVAQLGAGSDRLVKAAVIRGGSPAEALAGAVEAARLLDIIELIRALRSTSKEALRIAVKLDLAYPVDAARGKAIVVAPDVALALAQILDGAGYRTTRFVASRVSVRGEAPLSLVELGKRHGYPASFADRLIDLVDDPVEFDFGSTVGRELVGRPWHDADVRIVVGKQRTHSSHLVWGAFGALLGCYARPDRFRVLRQGPRALALSSVLLNARLPTHFAILDAWVSGDGAAGDLKPGRSNATKAVIASPEPLAADWLAAELMDFDPGLSPFLREAILRQGVLHLHRIGNLTPWTPWKNPSFLRAAIDQVIGEPRTTGTPRLPE